MRYLNEINSFYNWLTYNPLSSAAQALWNVLMHFNNKSAIEINGEFYWRVKFTAPNQMIMAMMTIKHDEQLKRARDELVTAGRIQYKKGVGNNAGTYQMIPFDTSLCEITVRQLLDKCEPVVRQSVTQSLALIDLDILIYINNNIYNNFFDVDDEYIYRAREKPTVDNSPMERMDSYFGMDKTIKKECTALANELFKQYFQRKALPNDILTVFELTYRREKDILTVDKDKQELLQYAFEQASRAGHTDWFYIKGVMDNLRRRGLKTYEDCIDYDANREFENDRRFGGI